MSQAIILIGGYNSIWPIYLKMARDLEDLSGQHAIGVPLLPWDWWAADRAHKATDLLDKLADTVRWARRRHRADRFLLVGHSAGGLLARLYLHTGPVWGHTYAGADHVDAIITLGSPHRGFQGWYLSDEANRLVPGTPYGDRVHYHLVAGRAVCGLPDGDYRQRRAFRLYSYFQGQGNSWGDGTVPVHSAGLDGVQTLVLDGVVHSGRTGPDWYGGAQAIVRRWWPTERSQSVLVSRAG